MITELERGRMVRPVAILLTASLITPTILAGCGGSQSSAPAPIDDTQGGRVPPPAMTRNQPRQGMSTKQKVILLAGAAALYYAYKKHQARASQQGQQIQYYRSKNGRIYYREPNNPRQVHWVTPPQPIRVPADEAEAYSGIQGYNNSRSGRGIDDLFPLR